MPINWEEHLLASGLSDRARRAGAAYAGPGAGNDIPEGDRPPIAFTGGLPDPSYLPAEELSAASRAVLADEPNAALQYGGARGLESLRQWLAQRWTMLDATPLTAANYTLTNGSAGALANVCETFLNDGDVALVESPSFPGSIRTIRAVTSRVQPVPVDAEGLDTDALSEVVANLARDGHRARLLYTIPNFHNPTGSTLSCARRERLLDLCDRHGILVVEDDAYGELAFDGEPPPSLYKLAGGRGVVKLGSFSKIVAPGLRVGWCQAAPRVVDALVATRSDMGTSPFVHRVLARLAHDGILDAQIPRLGARYAAKFLTMVDALESYCSDGATWNRPDGGFFVWVTLRDDVDQTTLAGSSRHHGVVFVSGGVFFVEQMEADGRRPAWGPGASRYIRLAFSYVDRGDIAEGIRRLGAALADARGALMGG